MSDMNTVSATELESENERLKVALRKMHRRAQIAEGAIQSAQAAVDFEKILISNHTARKSRVPYPYYEAFTLTAKRISRGLSRIYAARAAHGRKS